MIPEWWQTQDCQLVRGHKDTTMMKAGAMLMASSGCGRRRALIVIKQRATSRGRRVLVGDDDPFIQQKEGTRSG